MKMKKIVYGMAAAVLLCLAVSCGRQEKDAKYVFYFIGDGMGFTHVAAAEAYLAQERARRGYDLLGQPYHYRLVGGRYRPVHGREDDQRDALHHARFHHQPEKHCLQDT